MISKVEGVKNVDFKITAKGHGVVNWNGSTPLSSEGKTVENHTMPKLRGYTNLSGRVKEETGYQYKKEATDLDFKKTPLYISQNCTRHHLFREQAYDNHFANKDNALDLLCSLSGLLRGYVIPSTVSYKRTSPLLIEDLVDTLGNGNFEQFTHSGERDKSSFFSKTTFGDTLYVGYGSISIEQLQFLPLDNKFDRAVLNIKDNEGEVVGQKIQDFIKSLDPDRDPKVVFHKNYVRKGSVFNEGEVGLLLDDVAIDILVKKMLDLLANLSIRQGKGYMFVDTLEVDYNNSNKAMRIKRFPSEISPTPTDAYAVYFEGK